MKKTLFLTLILMLYALTVMHAQEDDNNYKDRSFSERLEEGVRPKTPSRITFYGELYARGWIGGHRGNIYVQGADMSGSDSYLGILWEFTPFTGVVFEFAAYPELNGMNAYFDKAYVYSDIAGEAGSDSMVAKISIGRFSFDSAFFNPVDPMNTGDDLQHDQNLDTLNWKLELGTKGDLYPIIFMIATDLDFGYRGAGASQIDHFNNRGASGMFEVRSEGFNIGDVANMSWNVYYMGRFFPHINSASTHPGEVMNKTQQTIGGTLGVTIAVAEGQSVKVGGGAEYNHWFYGGKAQTGGMTDALNKSFQSIDWEAGVAYVLSDQFAVAMAMRQDGYSHAQYAEVKNKAPYTDMHAAASFHYLGLKEMAKISLYVGFAYAFGSFYQSEEYKKAWNREEGNGYANGNPYGVDNINDYVAGNPISVDVGMGYHPTSNASIFFGYNYGTWGLEAPDYAFRDVNGSWGKIYLKGSYVW